MNHDAGRDRADDSDLPATGIDRDTGEENAEQDEAGSQAQDIAEDALRMRRREDLADIGDSTKGGSDNPAELIPQDMQDLVDHMNDMANSGRIDMDAFEGEPESMDDEDGTTSDWPEPGAEPKIPD